MDLRRKYARREGTPFVACPLKARLCSSHILSHLILTSVLGCKDYWSHFKWGLERLVTCPKSQSKEGTELVFKPKPNWLQHGGAFFVLFPVLKFWGGKFPFLLGGKWKDFSIEGGIRVVGTHLPLPTGAVSHNYEGTHKPSFSAERPLSPLDIAYLCFSLWPQMATTSPRGSVFMLRLSIFLLPGQLGEDCV